MGAIILHHQAWGKIYAMFTTHTRPRMRLLVTWLLLTVLLPILLTACGRQPEPAQEATQAPTPTELPAPQVSAPDQVVLVTPPQADAVISSEADPLLRELAASAGLEVVIKQEITQEEITPNIKVVVFTAVPENLGSLATSSPATQFVAISDEDWNPSQNVTIIRRRLDHTAFMAGYVAGMLAPNYRAGAILGAEDPLFIQSFINGVYYYCGICNAAVPPAGSYPYVTTRPSGSSASDWQAAFDEINARKINVLFVQESAYSPELMNYLSAMDVALIGLQTPPEEGRPRWAATIYADSLSPLRTIWEDLLNGSGGSVLNASIKASDIQPIIVQEGQVWLSEGKMMLAQKVMDDLRDNRIDPLPPLQ